MFYTRDYFCSKVTKAGYAEHPVDLLILSGLISSAGHRVSLIDAIVERLDFDSVKSRIDSLGLDAIIFLSGSISWKEDFVFLRQVKLAHPDTLLIGLGDVFLDSGVFEENSWIDAVIFDFTKDEVLNFASGRDDNFEGLCFRRGDKTYIPPRIRNFDDFAIPTPRHELFLGRKYSFHFVRADCPLPPFSPTMAAPLVVRFAFILRWVLNCGSWITFLKNCGTFTAWA